MNPIIEKVLKERGMNWLIAAMVEGSIGYHTPMHAKNDIQRYIDGQREEYCERCLSCFRGDLEEMILFDIRVFQSIEEINPEKAKRIIQFVEKSMKLDYISQETIGLLYPTIFI